MSQKKNFQFTAGTRKQWVIRSRAKRASQMAHISLSLTQLTYPYSNTPSSVNPIHTVCVISRWHFPPRGRRGAVSLAHTEKGNVGSARGKTVRRGRKSGGGYRASVRLEVTPPYNWDGRPPRYVVITDCDTGTGWTLLRHHGAMRLPFPFKHSWGVSDGCKCRASFFRGQSSDVGILKLLW